MKTPEDASFPTTVEQWQITSMGAVDLYILIILVVISIGLTVWTWRTLDPVFPRKYRIGITSARLAALLIAIGFLAQPSIHSRSLEDIPSQFAILVDVSESMTKGEQTTRLETAKQAVEKARNKLNKLAGRSQISWYQFADDLVSVDSEEKAFSKPEEISTGTNIENAVQRLLANPGDTPLNGIVIISDGADTESPPSSLEKEGLLWPKKTGFPLNTVFIGGTETRFDLAIKSVEVNPFAFSRSETPIVVALKSVGLPDDVVDVLLWQDGELVQRREARLVGGEGRLTFNVFPRKLGPHVFKITVPINKDDEIKENNETHVYFDVIRDKFRVLHVAGSPSWDQRFLREALDEWPKVDLVSFYVLRTAYQSRTLGSSGMALIPFPTEDVFKTHLNEFDVVIFQNFEPRAVGVDAYLDRIAAFVKEGGAFVLIGGGDGLKGGSLASGDLEEILPVKILKPGSSSAGLVDSVPFKPRITESGMRHPLTQIVKPGTEHGKKWSSLARLDGINRVASLSQGAFCLAEHPFVKADDGPSPVIAVKETGEGRALLVATDSMWRWRFTGPMEGGAADAYSEFWRQSILWLTKSPKLEGLRVQVSPSPALEGDPIGVDIELLDEGYRPVPRGQIEGLIHWPLHSGAEATHDFKATLDDHGRYHFEWTPKSEGPHVIEVTASTGLKSSTRFLVNTKNRELRHMEPNESLLKSIAQETGGVFQSGSLNPKQWATGGVSTHRVLSQTDEPLWDHPLAIMLLLLTLSTEWFLRRKIGLR